MKNATSLLVLAGLLLCGAGFAQVRDPASPKVGNKDRGRELLAVLGPKPHDAAGITPLQEQELNRRVRCAATRQEIQDELDFEAAGSTGFYVISQLRAMEEATCSPVAQLLAQQLAPRQPEPKQPAPHAMFQAQPQRTVAPPPLAVAQPLPQQPAPAPQPRPAPPAKPVSTAPAYTPAPDYPKADMEAGHEGIVQVQLVMNADGSVQSASVAQSSNYPTLDAAALTAARTWRIPAAAGRTIKVPLTFSTH